MAVGAGQAILVWRAQRDTALAAPSSFPHIVASIIQYYIRYYILYVKQACRVFACRAPCWRACLRSTFACSSTAPPWGCRQPARRRRRTRTAVPAAAGRRCRRRRWRWRGRVHGCSRSARCCMPCWRGWPGGHFGLVCCFGARWAGAGGRSHPALLAAQPNESFITIRSPLSLTSHALNTLSSPTALTL